ncbi:hypothetical protein GGI12_000525 [Dipsacomyces acuminosporus]|nr:hypothetical protein GGI12_000525 [Dipsacomyces acuminosporus]
MFKRISSKLATEQDPSNEPPVLELGDTDPLPPECGDVASLPPEYQAPVKRSFIRHLQDAKASASSSLGWLSPKLAPAARLNSFMAYLGSRAPNEVVWLYARYRKMLFSIASTAFAKQIESLNALPERLLSPTSRPIFDLWMPVICLHQLIEFLPHVFAHGWKRSQIESIMIVLLDHGNNPALRYLGFYTLTVYMTSLNGEYPESIIELYENAIYIRALTYVDRPLASQVSGDLMCAISSGRDIANIGCGQRPIIGNICPVLQDTVYSINPQGIAALTMMKGALSYVSYLASLLPSTQSSYIRYCKMGVLGSIPDRLAFNMNAHRQPSGHPPHVPMMAVSSSEVQTTLKSMFRLFRDKYLSWIYVDDEAPNAQRHVRRVPVLALRVFVSFMLESLVPRFAYMLSEGLCTPNINKSIGGLGERTKSENISSTVAVQQTPVSGSVPESAGDVEKMDSRAYTILRHVLLDNDVKSACFFIDILRLSLQCFADIASSKRAADEDLLGKEELLNESYVVSLSALTVLRVWMASEEKYRPIHLVLNGAAPENLDFVITDYMKYVHRLLAFLVDLDSWDDSQTVVRSYKCSLSTNTVVQIVSSLQDAVGSFLKRVPKCPDDYLNKRSSANQALTMLTECLTSSWLAVDLPVPELIGHCERFFAMPTVWLCHLSVWGNVLKALTVARGPYILDIDERILIHEIMFSGQRQRKGLNKVDEYLEKLGSKSYHLEPVSISGSDSFATSTPFNITSNSVWETMRAVFASIQASAKVASLDRDACRLNTYVSDERLVSGTRAADQLALRSRAEHNIYFQICHSAPANLRQMDSTLSKDVLATASKGVSKQAKSQRTSKVLKMPELHEHMGEPSRDKGKQRDQASELSGLQTGESTFSSFMWRRILTPIPRASSDISNSAAACRKPSARYTQSGTLRERSHTEEGATGYAGTDTPASCSSGGSSSSSRRRRGSPTNVHPKHKKAGAIGPAEFKVHGHSWSTTLRYTHHQLRSAVRGADIETQKLQVHMLDVKASEYPATPIATSDIYDVILATPWVIEAANRFSADDDIGKMAQMAIFQMGCRSSEHGNAKALFLSSRFLETVLIALSPLARGLPVNMSQIEMVFAECQHLISVGVVGAHLVFLLLNMALQRVFLKQETLGGGLASEPAIQGATTLLISMCTFLGTERGVSTNHRHPKARPLSDSHMVETAGGIDKLVSAGGRPVSAKYPTIYKPLGEDKCVPCNVYIEHRVLSALSVICFTELKITDKSLQHGRLIDNCLVSVASRLFSTQADIARIATSIVYMFTVGQADIVQFLGRKRARFLTLQIMKAIVEHLDRCPGNIVIEDTPTIWGLIRVLAILLISAPELITKETPDAEDSSEESIRDFLVEKVIRYCAHPTLSANYAGHQYNQQLLCKQSTDGLTLELEHAPYNASATSSGRSPQGYDRKWESRSQPAVDAIKQFGVILYTSLMLRFDRGDWFCTASNSVSEATDIDPFAKGFDSSRAYFYSHGNCIFMFYDEKDTESCKLVVRVATGKNVAQLHFMPSSRISSANKMDKSARHPYRTPCETISDFGNMFKDQGAGSKVTFAKVLKEDRSRSTVSELSEPRNANTDEDVHVRESSNRLFAKIDEFLQEEWHAQDGICNEDAPSSRGSAFLGSTGARQPYAEGEDTKNSNTVYVAGMRLNCLSFAQLGNCYIYANKRSRRLHAFLQNGRPQEFELNYDLIQQKLVENKLDSIIEHYVPLAKSESLYRDISALDSIYAKDTVKVALFYVGVGQRTETEILSNTIGDTSRSYRSFVDSLGWQIDLATFPGFTGKLSKDQSDGKTCTYFADTSVELVFHEASSMPLDPKDPRQMTKVMAVCLLRPPNWQILNKRHIGNDHVHIVWNESGRDYRPETISGDFGNVQIQIRPLAAGQYGIGIYCDEHIKPFGPLVDGMVVSVDVLPSVVRATAINGHQRSVEAFFKSSSHPYIIRQQSISKIVEKHTSSTGQSIGI